MTKQAPATISSINIVVHTTLRGAETRIVSRQNASDLPPEVRDAVTFPCIVTGTHGMSKSMLTLMVAQTLSEYLDAQAARESFAASD